MTIAYLNGEYLPLEKATVPAMDRGFLFGDGVYELIPVYNQKLFRAEEHLRRLRRSLEGIQLKINISDDKWKEIFQQLITRNTGKDQSIYLQVTRGYWPIRCHEFPKKVTPTLFAYSTELVSKSIAELAQGVNAITANDNRWDNCFIKAINLLPNVLQRQLATENGANEAILIKDGYALEGATSNLFIVMNGAIITPPADKHILSGITRELIIEILARQDMPHEIKPIPEEQLRHADEIWITSSSREIVPVIKLDNKIVGTGVAGPVWHNAIRYYQDYKAKL